MTDAIKQQASCADDYDPASISPQEANRRIQKDLIAVEEAETLPIRACLGRVLAKDIRSTINVPTATNSAMDGYAIVGADLPKEGLHSLTLIGESFAGRPFHGSVGKGECVRIMTGAVMPEGTDTVVMQEHVQADGHTIQISNRTQHGANVREAGEDIQQGQTVLTAGTEITPAELGLVASLGIADIEVFRKLRVAFFSTGDELRSIGQELEDGCIYDSNRYTLYGMLHRLGVEIIDLGVAEDKQETIENSLQEAASQADVILTSGGVSVGEADYVKQSLEQLGEINFWKIAMKPGRPVTFGKIQNAWFFGLPGNPVSVMVGFYQFVQPALKLLMGASNHLPIIMQVTCASKLKKRPGRMEYQRGVVYQNENGEFVVEKTGQQGSGILRSMSMANCFIILPTESEGIKPGDSVKIQPFFGLV